MLVMINGKYYEADEVRELWVGLVSQGETPTASSYAVKGYISGKHLEKTVDLSAPTTMEKAVKVMDAVSKKVNESRTAITSRRP